MNIRCRGVCCSELRPVPEGWVVNSQEAARERGLSKPLGDNPGDNPAG